jgi:histidine triad (HIT) family protein
MDCVFCRIVAGSIPCVKVYEDAESLAFMDINPLTPGHLLVVPKAHVETLFDADEARVASLARIATRIAKSLRESLGIQALNMLQANGQAAFQSVPHLHLHLIPRRPGDGAGFDWKLVPGDMEEIRRLGETIRAGLG